MGQFWWGVVVALSLNLAAAYLKPRLDTWLLTTSSWWRSRSAKRIAARKMVLDDLRDPDRQMVALANGLWNGFIGAFLLLIAIMFMVIIDSSLGLNDPTVHIFRRIMFGAVIFCYALFVQALARFLGELNTLKDAIRAKIRDRENPATEPSAAVTLP